MRGADSCWVIIFALFECMRLGLDALAGWAVGTPAAGSWTQHHKTCFCQHGCASHVLVGPVDAAVVALLPQAGRAPLWLGATVSASDLLSP